MKARQTLILETQIEVGRALGRNGLLQREAVLYSEFTRHGILGHSRGGIPGHPGPLSLHERHFAGVVHGPMDRPAPQPRQIAVHPGEHGLLLSGLKPIIQGQSGQGVVVREASLRH